MLGLALAIIFSLLLGILSIKSSMEVSFKWRDQIWEAIPLYVVFLWFLLVALLFFIFANFIRFLSRNIIIERKKNTDTFLSNNNISVDSKGGISRSQTVAANTQVSGDNQYLEENSHRQKWITFKQKIRSILFKEII